MNEHGSEWLAVAAAAAPPTTGEHQARRYASRLATLRALAQLEMSERQARRYASRLTSMIEARENAMVIATRSDPRDQGTSAGPEGTGPNDRSGPETASAHTPDMATMLIHLQDEIAFLRSTLEDHARAEAKFRAALRETLRMEPDAQPSTQEPPDTSGAMNASNVPHTSDATHTPDIASTTDAAETSAGMAPPDMAETSAATLNPHELAHGRAEELREATAEAVDEPLQPGLEGMEPVPVGTDAVGVDAVEVRIEQIKEAFKEEPQPPQRYWWQFWNW
jgi:hypothetical protein